MSPTREVPREQWSSYLDEVTRKMDNAELSIEVAHDPMPLELEADRVALQFLAYDERDDLFEVAGTVQSSHIPDVIRCVVSSPRSIVTQTANGPRNRIEVQDGEGARMVITLERPELS
jgi:hypothetical protein